MDSSQVLGSVEVEVKANLDKLTADFARGKAQAKEFNKDIASLSAQTLVLNKSMAAVSGQTQKFAGDMVTFNRFAREQEAAQIRNALAAKRMAAQQIATAAALNAVTRATNPAVASTRLVSSAVRDAEKAYMAGSISANALARAQQLGAPWLAKTEVASTHLGRSFIQTARSTRFLISALGFSAIGAGAAFVVKTLQATAALGDQARQLGLTTAQLQEYHGIAAQVGMSAADMDSAFSTLGKNIDDLSLGRIGPFSKMLKKMGVDIRDSAGNIKPTDALFKTLIDRLGQVGNEAQRRGGQMIAFGEAGAKMGQLVAQGSPGIDRLRKAVADTGAVLSEKEIQDADVAAKKLDEVKTVLSADFASVVEHNAAAIVSLAQSLGALAGGVLSFLNSDPQSALAIIGALGGAMFGPEGAALGALGGFAVGTKMRESREKAISDANMDVKFRMQQVRDAKAAVANARAAPDVGDRVMPGIGTSASAGGKANIMAANNELLRQAALLNQATGLASGGKATTKKGPNIDLSGILSPKGAKAKQAKFDQFDADLAREKQQQLQLERDATGNLVRQNEIDHEIVDMKLAQQIQQIKRQQHNGQLTASEAKQLIAEAQTTAAMEKEAADRKMRIATIERQNQFADELAQLEQDGLAVARAMARTDDERKRIDLAILDSKQGQVKSELQKEIALAQEAGNEERVAELTAELAKLRANQLAEIRQFDVEHLTGVAKFKNDLPQNSEQMAQAIKDMKFDLFNQKLQQAAGFADDIGSAFGRLGSDLAQFKNPLTALKSLISDLAATFTKNFIEKPIKDWATQHIGIPAAKQAFGKDINKLAGPDALTAQQFDVALAQATGSLGALQAAASPASGSIGTITAAATPAATSLTALTSAATTAAAALTAAASAAGAKAAGSGLSSIIGAAAGAAGGGGGLDLGGSAPLASLPGGLDLGMVNSLPGFDSGGYTGTGGAGEVTGLVHANEFVLNSSAVGKYGTSLLGAMNSGSAATGPLGAPGTGAGAPDMASAAAMLMTASQALLEAANKLGGGGGGGGGFLKSMLGIGLGFLLGGKSGAGSSLMGLFGGGKASSLGGIALGGGSLASLPGGLDLGMVNSLPGFDMGGFTGSGPRRKIAGVVHANEFVWDVDTTRRFQPLLAMISAGKLPGFTSPSVPGMGRGDQHNHFDLGGVHVHGVRDERAARRSGRQALGEIQRGLGQVVKTGLNR